MFQPSLTDKYRPAIPPKTEHWNIVYISMTYRPTRWNITGHYRTLHRYTRNNTPVYDLT